MDVLRKAARFIDSHRLELAEAVVQRQYELQPALADRYGAQGRGKCVQDTAYHLAHLAASLRARDPALFVDYLSWAKTVMVAYQIRLEDVEHNLRLLADVMSARLPADVASVVADYFKLGLATFAGATAETPSFLAGDEPLAKIAQQFLEELLRGQRPRASQLVFEALRAGFSISDIYTGIFEPCQREVGRLWQHRRITVAQEHYCTAATQLVMSQLYPHLFETPRKGRRLVAASVSGEAHEVGLRIVTDLLEFDGWDTTYLGANVPAAAVVQAVFDNRADVLLISATMAFHLSAVEEQIDAVRARPAGRDVKIVVGGKPFNVALGLWRQVGADGWAGVATDAVHVVNRLLEEDAQPSAARSVAPATLPISAQVPIEPATPWDQLGRLNSELITLQREMARKNVELQTLNERLAAADRHKNVFLATLAHELRAPLAPLLHAVSILQHPKVEPTAAAQVGGVVKRQVEQISGLVNDLMDLARVARGKLELRPETLEVGDLLQKAVETVRPILDERAHQLTISAPETPLRLVADPLRLRQVLVNLLSNAARYTPPSGEIDLSAEARPPWLVIRVRDNGIGIAPEQLPHIFQPFDQGEGTSPSHVGGLGLGLALVKQLTELHGGTVEMHSPGVGLGSEFIVRLPLPVRSTLEDANR